MANEELVRAFTEGRLSRRAFVRKLVDDGMSMPVALSYAEALTPARTPGAAATDAVRFDSAATPHEPLQGDRLDTTATPVRIENLEISFVGDGYLVYQPDRDRVHSLNHTAAIVLELCTGENDQGEIARLLQECYELPEPPEVETRHCLEALFEEGLIR